MTETMPMSVVYLVVSFFSQFISTKTFYLFISSAKFYSQNIVNFRQKLKSIPVSLLHFRLNPFCHFCFSARDAKSFTIIKKKQHMFDNMLVDLDKTLCLVVNKRSKSKPCLLPKPVPFDFHAVLKTPMPIFSLKHDLLISTKYIQLSTL